MIRKLIFLLFFLVLGLATYSQYFEPFENTKTQFAENNLPGWTTRTGDGDISFFQQYTGESVLLKIDPLKDKRNVWYAFIHQDISEFIDVEKLLKPEFELRMEIRVKTSHAPRRINMYLSELDKGGYLREFDIDEANKWVTISMVTESFTPAKERPVMAQVSLMDWGISDIYTLEIDYIKVDVVSNSEQLTQFGLPLVYRPSVKPPDAFSNNFIATKAISVNAAYPDMNFNNLISETDEVRLLNIDPTGMIILSWDFSSVNGKEINGAGQMELFTHHLIRLSDSPKDFGEIRICEILTDDGEWDETTIDYNRFFKEHPKEKVINGQTVIDTKVYPEMGGKTAVSISKPVLQRLVSGKSKGLAILPLGYISVAFYTNDYPDKAPLMRLNILE